MPATPPVLSPAALTSPAEAVVPPELVPPELVPPEWVPALIALPPAACPELSPLPLQAAAKPRTKNRATVKRMRREVMRISRE